MEPASRRFVTRAKGLLTASPCIELLRARPRLAADIQRSAGECGELTALVYFNNNDASLTPDATLVLEDAANRTAQCAVRRVTVEAHEDYGLSEDAAVAIAERRAASVSDYLVSRGITVSERLSLGTKQPLEAGVPNPANRRAVVRFELADR